ncbi:MAG: glycosyltransferase family 29 protein [Planctomycetes bacterium]|nr:glycosyltransferase family 29 protein [Planctomycetota bacterium]
MAQAHANPTAAASAQKALAPRVLIIGNAPVQVDYSEFVDASEHVIRMNECPNYDANTGTRTTVLGLINIGVTGRDLYKKQSLRDWRVAQQVDEIWFRWWRFNAWDVLKTFVAHPRTRKQHLDYGDKLVRANALEGKHLVYAQRAFINSVKKKLWEVDRGRPWKKVLPTSGFLIIERVLADPRFKDREVNLLGFTWEAGSNKRSYRSGHTWDEEETLVQRYVEQGRLKILPCDAP